MRKISILFLIIAASVCGAQDNPPYCSAGVDRTEQMKAAVVASHGKGAYFEVNDCSWHPGKNPREKKLSKQGVSRAPIVWTSTTSGIIGPISGGAQQKTVKPALTSQVNGNLARSPTCAKGTYLANDNTCHEDKTGKHFPSADGCNTTTCLDANCRSMSSTSMACVPNGPDDPKVGPFGLPGDSYVQHPVETVPLFTPSGVFPMMDGSLLVGTARPSNLTINFLYDEGEMVFFGEGPKLLEAYDGNGTVCFTVYRDGRAEYNDASKVGDVTKSFWQEFARLYVQEEIQDKDAARINAVLEGIGAHLFTRLEKSKFSPDDRTEIAVMVRSAMEDYKREAAKDGKK